VRPDGQACQRRKLRVSIAQKMRHDWQLNWDVQRYQITPGVEMTTLKSAFCATYDWQENERNLGFEATIQTGTVLA
jgi:hypothetical protein